MDGNKRRTSISLQPKPIIKHEHHKSTFAVWAAIGGNLTIAVLKFVAYALTGSGSMLSEGIHSVVDTLNQCLLLIGINESEVKEEEPPETHFRTLPTGNYRKAFVWALISAVGIFFLGSGVTVYHGITQLLEPGSLDQIEVALGVLLIGFVVEGYTLLIAVLVVRKQAASAGTSFFHFCMHGDDPMAVAVVVEDSVAVFGVLIAGSAIVLSHLTENLVFDAIGSLLIGIMLGLVACFLIRKNALLLAGQSPGKEKLTKFDAITRKHPGVKWTADVRGEMIGMGKVRLKADVEFDGQYIGQVALKRVLDKDRKKDIRELYSALKTPEQLQAFLLTYTEEVVDSMGDIVNEIEKDVREEFPGAEYVDLEAN